MARGDTNRIFSGRNIAILVTVVVLASIIGIAISNRSVPPTASEAPTYALLVVGQAAPPFSVTTIDGNHFDSSRISKPIMLEVFATWCPHCQHETVQMNAMRAHFGSRLAIVAASGSNIGADRQSPETLDDVKGFAQHFSVAYPIAFDPNLGVAKAYLQGGFPTIVFIDKSKHVTAIESGEIALKTLLADAKAAGVR